MSVVSRLHRLERIVLPALLEAFSLEGVMGKTGLQEVEVLRAFRWLGEKKLVSLKEESHEVAGLDFNGKVYLDKGLPEKRFVGALKSGSKKLPELMKSASLSREEVNVCIGMLRKRGLIGVAKGEEPVFSITEKGKRAVFEEQGFLDKLVSPLKLSSLSSLEKRLLESLKGRRGIVRISERKSVSASLTAEGKKAAASPKLKEKVVDRLTPDMLRDGSWVKANFRSYSLDAPVPRVFFGKKQPYRRFLDEVRARLVALGFKEMSGPVVESEFWNMDALFMPQFHSARDIHDAYYIKEPTHAKDLPRELVGKVKSAHEKGIKGSRGWRYGFRVEKTSRLILRSQDTSISPRTLSSKELEIPGKYFQIARCFRYDVIDATHNADFDQIGGFVVGDGLNLRHLFGILRMFAVEFCGTDEVRVVPSYFPFTEPSAALYARHPAMGWIELAGAGIFRPEMTVPLGVDRPVIAWGIGLGRVAMFRLGLKDIRQLYSHDLEYLRSARVI